MKKLLALIFTLFLLVSPTLKADIVVLVHGYLGSSDSWQYSGINNQLAAAGWKHAGDIIDSPIGSLLIGFPETTPDKPIYSVNLPSRAPAGIQADILQNMITDLEKRHPEENITLVGHSAGGVVARLKLVRYGAGQVNRLITIASPHLGTLIAVKALDETHDILPIDIIKSFFGGDLYHTVKSSTGLLVDLVPSHPGSLLYWLNSQPHPQIQYISIIRGLDESRNGDRIIPGFSQDMNNVPALRGKSQRYYLPTEHLLNPYDGDFLAKLLNGEA